LCIIVSQIATLVLSSSNQEANIAELKSEICQLQALLDRRSSPGADAAQQLKELEASRRREVELLKERTHDLTIELKQTKRKLLSATGQLDNAMAQLKVANTMPDVQDLAGRLVIAEQGQKMLRTENIDKLKERDAAIANLLQSVQANEGVISNLRNDIDNFKRKLNDSIEENRRLQHESEIFATQVGDFNTC
jgi:chromosome segregation ATPase